MMMEHTQYGEGMGDPPAWLPDLQLPGSILKALLWAKRFLVILADGMTIPAAARLHG